MMLLKQCSQSNKAELVAVYGRRRIGKTFLVKSFFEEKFDFYVSGIFNGTKQQELEHFHEKLCEYSRFAYPMPRSWKEAFELLKHYLGGIKKKKAIVFIDEMPWLDTPRSQFLQAFDLFWNEWASTRNNLCVIVCDSATTWMNDHLISQKGGLHNRVTCNIRLSPFNLSETEQMLEAKKIVWTRHQVAECWMILGGTPYYLDLLRPGMSLPQNIDFLFFRPGAQLRDEYPQLLKSLFKEAVLYRRIIETLAKKAKGMTRSELIETLGIKEGGRVTSFLENLCHCDFVREYAAYGKKSRDTMYQLTDMFTLFYLKFVQNGEGADEHFWSHSIDFPSRRAWSGYAFEQLCLHHIPQIKEALGISGILSHVYSWQQKADKEQHLIGRQIDLLIDRRDQVINVCEMKFSVGPYTITKGYWQEMLERQESFRSTTKTRSALHLTMITASGLVNNEYAASVPVSLTLNELFR